MPVPSLLILGGIVLILLGLATLKKPIIVEMTIKARIIAFITGIGLISLGTFFFVQQIRVTEVQKLEAEVAEPVSVTPVPGVVALTPSSLPSPPPADAVIEDTSASVTRILYETQETYHLGDEFVQGWEKLLGECLTILFQTDLPADSLTLQFESFGISEREVVRVNGTEILIIPPMSEVATDSWSGSRSIPIPVSLLQAGGNRLDICAAPLTLNPSFPGEKDDFQMRNITLVAEYGRCK